MPAGKKAVQIKQHLLYDFISLDLLEEAYDMALQIISATKANEQSQTIIQAYLIAQILSDTDKINHIKELLPSDWNTDIQTQNWPKILQKALSVNTEKYSF